MNNVGNTNLQLTNVHENKAKYPLNHYHIIFVIATIASSYLAAVQCRLQ